MTNIAIKPELVSKLVSNHLARILDTKYSYNIVLELNELVTDSIRVGIVLATESTEGR